MANSDMSNIFNNPINNSFFLEIAKGNVSGHKMFSIPGRKDALSTTVLDDFSQIPATIVILDPGGIQLEIVSTDAADDGDPVGTGVQTVMIVYLDINGDEQTETITMNGAGAVTTVATDIDKIQWMHAVTVGSGTVAAGNISLQGVSGGTVYEYIAAGGNQSLSCHYHIPNNKTGFLLGWQASGITKIIDIRLRATIMRFNRNLITAFVFQDAAVVNNSTTGWVPFDIPKLCPTGSTIKVSGISGTAGGDGAAQFDVLLIDNDKL